MKKSACCNANCINKMENLTTFAVCTKCGRECGEITPEQDNWKNDFGFSKKFSSGGRQDGFNYLEDVKKDDIIAYISSLLSSQAHALKERMKEIVEKAPTKGYYRNYVHKPSVLSAIESIEI